MADETKVIILGIELDINSLISASAQAKKEIDDLKKTQKELTAAGQGASEQFEENASKLRELNGVYRETQKQIDNTKKSRDLEKGSINAMRAELGVATQKYNALSEAQRNNANVGGKLQTQIKGLSDKLKANESAIGDNRRNVGNYTDSLGKLFPGFSQAAEGAGKLNAALLELLLNPIGLIIAAIVLSLVALYKAFKSTDSGGTELEARFKQLGVVIDVITQRVAAFAKGLIEVFKGNFSEGAKQMGGAFTGISDQIKNATDAAYNYIIALDKLDDEQDNFISQTSKNQNEIAKLEALAADQTASTEARRNALKESIEIQREELSTQKDFAQKRYELELQNESARLNVNKNTLKKFIESSGDASEKLLQNDKSLAVARDNLGNEGQKKLEEFYSKSIDLDTQFFQENKRNISKLSGFEKEIQDKKIKDAQDLLKIKIAKLKEELIGVKDFTPEYLRIKSDLFEQEKTLELKAKDLTKNQKALIEEQYNTQVKQLAFDTVQYQISITKKQLQESLQSETEFIQQKKLLYSIDSLNAQDALIDKKEQGLINEHEFIDQTNQLKFDARQKEKEFEIQELQQKLQFTTDSETKRLEIVNSIKEKEVEYHADAERRKTEEAKRQYNTQKELTQGSLNAAGDLFGAIASMAKEGSEDYKAFAILQAVASTASGAIGAFSQAASTYAPPYGEVIGAVAAAAVVAAGGVQIAKIQSLESGGYGYTTKGNPHEEAKNLGNKSYTYHKSEYIVPAKVLNTPTGSAMVNTLESMRKGNHINLGLPGMADGGFATRFTSSPIIQRLESQQNVEQILQNLPPQFVIVESINEVQGRVAKVASRADI